MASRWGQGNSPPASAHGRARLRWRLCRFEQTRWIGLLLKIESKSDVDPGAVVIRVNRNHPGCWGHDDTSAHVGVHRDIGAVIRAIRVFDCFSIALPVTLVVGLLSFVGVVIVIAMGLSSGADPEASDSNQKRSNAETLGERHG